MSDRAAPPPLDELLARREWVRRFARTLARDDASADDLAQDAWVAAVETPPRHADAPAGWLRRVLVRRAIDVTRGERRREARESAASRRETSPATADVVAAAESHRRVVEAVMALDEPYRATVLLRFFEGLPPREVAARMGVPVETVRARVRRAVEKLRTRLDEEHGGKRAAWLAPLLATGRGETSPVPIGAWATGATAMTTSTKTGLAVAALVLLLIGAGVVVSSIRTTSSDDEVAQASRDAKATTPRRPRTRVGNEAGVDASGTSAPAQVATQVAPANPAPPAREFVVRVVDAKNAPVPGVRVHVDVAGRRSDAVTDDRGSATFQVVADVQSASADHEAADGHAWRQRGNVRRVAAGATEVELVVERWEPIRGRVVGEDRRPIRDAEVYAIMDGGKIAEAISDDDGRFSFPVPPDAACGVAVTGRIHGGPDRAAADDIVGDAHPVSPGGDELVLVARAAASRATVRVRAVTSDGRPLGGVSIAVTTPSSWYPLAADGLTDADGRVVFEDVPQRLVRVSVETQYGTSPSWDRAAWIAPAWESFVRPGDEELKLVFAAGRPIHGRVEFPADYPRAAMPGVVGPRAFVVLSDENGNCLARAWSDEDRRFAVLAPATAKGPFRLSCGLSDESRRSFEAEATGVPPDAQDVVLKIVERKF